MNHSLKLTIELVPSTSWYNNLRSLMPKEKWDVLRKKVYADFGYRCGICGVTGELHAHEIWKYDDVNHVQSLMGLIALCKMCHAVKHLGRTELKEQEEGIQMEEVIAHFMKINKCTKTEFEAHRKEAFRIWEERSKHQWQIKINEFLVE